MTIPKAIKTEKQHDQVVDQIGRLSIRGDLNKRELQYVGALAKVVGEYEDRAGHRLKLSRPDPIRTLKFLMNETKMSVSRLEKIIGAKGVASEILSGRRELSKTHIGKLAEYFHVAPRLFMKSDSE